VAGASPISPIHGGSTVIKMAGTPGDGTRISRTKELHSTSPWRKTASERSLINGINIYL
jgi:hypothetical protein